MKIKFVLVFIFISFLLFTQDAIELKKGQTAPFNGFLVTPERLEELIKNNKMLQEEVNSYKNVQIPELTNQIGIIKKEKDLIAQQNDFLTQKFNIEQGLREYYQNQLKTSEVKIRVLSVFCSVGWSLFLAESISLGISIGINNYYNNNY